MTSINAPYCEKVELFDIIIEIDFERVGFFVVRRNRHEGIEENIEIDNELRKKILNAASFNGAKAYFTNGIIILSISLKLLFSFNPFFEKCCNIDIKNRL